MNWVRRKLEFEADVEIDVALIYAYKAFWRQPYFGGKLIPPSHLRRCQDTSEVIKSRPLNAAICPCESRSAAVCDWCLLRINLTVHDSSTNKFYVPARLRQEQDI